MELYSTNRLVYGRFHFKFRKTGNKLIEIFHKEKKKTFIISLFTWIEAQNCHIYVTFKSKTKMKCKINIEKRSMLIDFSHDVTPEEIHMQCTGQDDERKKCLSCLCSYVM